MIDKRESKNMIRYLLDYDRRLRDKCILKLFSLFWFDVGSHRIGPRKKWSTSRMKPSPSGTQKTPLLRLVLRLFFASILLSAASFFFQPNRMVEYLLVS